MSSGRFWYTPHFLKIDAQAYVKIDVEFIMHH